MSIWLHAHSFFQWQDILQIIIPRSSALAAAAAGGGNNPSREEGNTTCPICLSPPTAPRMTKCGHVSDFLSDVARAAPHLHFIRRCSVSNAYYTILVHQKIPSGPAVRFVLTRSTRNNSRAFIGLLHRPTLDGNNDDGTHLHHRLHQSLPTIIRRETPKPGSTLRMRLMQRPQITTLALPRSHTWPSDLLPPHQAPFHFLPDVYTYAKFMLATPIISHREPHTRPF
jgi:hypothetical protein